MGEDRRRGRAVLRADRKHATQNGQTPHGQIQSEAQMNKHIDPVCGMAVDPATAAGQFEYASQTYYFCSTNCLRKFSADPQAYLNKPSQPHAMQPMVQLGSKVKSLPVMQA